MSIKVLIFWSRYYDLCAWGSSYLSKENRTQTHKLIDGSALTSPYISPLDWSPMQSDGGRDVGDGKLMCECRHQNDRLFACVLLYISTLAYSSLFL